MVVYQGALQRGRLPESTRAAVITVMQKGGGDPQQRANYRPTALINVDEKIPAKILATRLEVVALFLIHQNQLGSMWARSSRDNLQ